MCEMYRPPASFQGEGQKGAGILSHGEIPRVAPGAVEILMRPENQAINKGWIGYMGKTMGPQSPKERLSWTRVD